MNFVTTLRKFRWAAMAGVALACGGETTDGTHNQTLDATGGYWPMDVSSSGGSNSLGGAAAAGGVAAMGGRAATGGAAGCANRAIVYDDSTVFPSAMLDLDMLPECIPTCGRSTNSIQSLPAGPCTADPTCQFMILPDSGIWRYYRCDCGSQQWSCILVS